MMTSRVAASRLAKLSFAGASASGSGASGTREHTNGSSSIVCWLAVCQSRVCTCAIASSTQRTAFETIGRQAVALQVRVVVHLVIDPLLQHTSAPHPVLSSQRSHLQLDAPINSLTTVHEYEYSTYVFAAEAACTRAEARWCYAANAGQDHRRWYSRLWGKEVVWPHRCERCAKAAAPSHLFRWAPRRSSGSPYTHGIWCVCATRKCRQSRNTALHSSPTRS